MFWRGRVGRSKDNVRIDPEVVHQSS
jgi:hypothetical protein